MSASYEKISDVSSIQFLQGDWVFCDIDKTLLTVGPKKYSDPVTPIQSTVITMKSLQERGFKVILLTARTGKRALETIQHIADAGLTLTPFPNPSHIEILEKIQFQYKSHKFKAGILFAKQIGTQLQKANVLRIFLNNVLSLEGIIRPRRIVSIDDSEEELTVQLGKASEIFSQTLSGNLPSIKLFQFSPEKLKLRGFPSENPNFPEDLSELTYIKHLYGGTGGAHILEDEAKNRFVLKAGNSVHRMKDEILSDAIYRLLGPFLGVHVADFAIYKDLPDQLAQKLNLPVTGIYRLSTYIDADPDWGQHQTWLNRGDQSDKYFLSKSPTWKDQSAAIVQGMSSGYVLDAFLGNNDIATHWFNILVDKLGRVWRIDNGSTKRFWGAGEVKGVHGSTAEQLDTFLQTKVGSFFYGSLTEDQKKTQAKIIIEKAPEILDTIEKLHAQLNFAKYGELIEKFYEGFADLQEIFHLDEPQYPQRYMRAIKGKTAAGIFFSSKINGEMYVLLGKRSRQEWWGNLGGKSDEDLLLANTASREAYEESFGLCLARTVHLLQRPFVDLLNPKKQGPYRYRMYFVTSNTHTPASRYNELIQKLPEDKREQDEFCWIKAADLLNSIENPQYVTVHSQQGIRVKALTEDGSTREFSMHPPFGTMLLQERSKELLRELVAPKSKLKPKPAIKWVKYPLVDPISARCEIANNVLIHAKMIKALDAQFSAKPFKIEAGIKADVDDQLWLSQSEIQLKAILKDKYHVGQLEKNIEEFKALDPRLKSADPYYLQLIPQILAEERKRKDSVCFYSATDQTVGFFIDMFTEYRKQLHGIVSDEYHVFRAFDHNFTYKDVGEFISFFLALGNGSIDNYQGNYPELGLSTNLFLLGRYLSETSATFHLYMGNVSRKPPSLEHMLEYIRLHLGLSATTMHFLNHFFLSHPIKGGRLYQIFIDKNHVDRLCYPAGDIGSLNEYDHVGRKVRSITELLDLLRNDPAKNAGYIDKLQSRIYLKPEIMHDPSIVQVKQYLSPGNEHYDQYQLSLKLFVELMIYETLAGKSALIPGTFKVRSSLLTQNDSVCALQGLPKDDATHEVYFPRLVKMNDISSIKAFILKYPEYDLRRIPNPDYMNARAPKFISALDLVGGAGWQETYLFLYISLLKQSRNPEKQALGLRYEAVAKYCDPIDWSHINSFEKVNTVLRRLNRIQIDLWPDHLTKFFLLKDLQSKWNYFVDPSMTRLVEVLKGIPPDRLVEIGNNLIQVQNFLKFKEFRNPEIRSFFEDFAKLEKGLDPSILSAVERFYTLSPPQNISHAFIYYNRVLEIVVEHHEKISEEHFAAATLLKPITDIYPTLIEALLLIPTERVSEIAEALSRWSINAFDLSNILHCVTLFPPGKVGAFVKAANPLINVYPCPQMILKGICVAAKENIDKYHEIMQLLLEKKDQPLLNDIFQNIKAISSEDESEILRIWKQSPPPPEFFTFRVYLHEIEGIFLKLIKLSKDDLELIHKAARGFNIEFTHRKRDLLKSFQNLIDNGLAYYRFLNGIADREHRNLVVDKVRDLMVRNFDEKIDLGITDTYLKVTRLLAEIPKENLSIIADSIKVHFKISYYDSDYYPTLLTNLMNIPVTKLKTHLTMANSIWRLLGGRETGNPRASHIAVIIAPLAEDILEGVFEILTWMNIDKSVDYSHLSKVVARLSGIPKDTLRAIIAEAKPQCKYLKRRKYIWAIVKQLVNKHTSTKK